MDAATVMERCDALQEYTEEPGKLTRLFATPALEAATAAVEGWMREAGLATRRDAVRNLFGRYEGSQPDAPAFLLGSHLDSVPDGGRYDGPLGVLTALAVVERLAARGVRLPFALEVCAFSDEESVRYGTAYLGSSAVAGAFDEAWLDRVDRDGVAMRDALRDIGGDPDDIAVVRPRRGRRPSAGSSCTSSRARRSSRRGCRSASSRASRRRCATPGRSAAPPATPAPRRWPAAATRSRPPPSWCSRSRRSAARRPTWSRPSACWTPSRAR